MDEHDKKKKTKEVIKVLELEGHLITVDSRNWILDGNSFYPTLADSLKALSDVLLKNKLKGRPASDIPRLASLIITIEEHHEWFKEQTKGEHQWDIKVYDEDVKVAMEKSELVDKYFEEKYGSGR